MMTIKTTTRLPPIPKKNINEFPYYLVIDRVMLHYEKKNTFTVLGRDDHLFNFQFSALDTYLYHAETVGTESGQVGGLVHLSLSQLSPRWYIKIYLVKIDWPTFFLLLQK